MRATYVPGPAASGHVARWLVRAPDPQAGGELWLYLRDYPEAHRRALTSTELQQLLQRWTAAAREGRGELEVDEEEERG
jgi:hypothetical protein